MQVGAGGRKGHRFSRKFTRASVNFSSMRPATGGWWGLGRNYIQRYHIACDAEALALAAAPAGSRVITPQGDAHAFTPTRGTRSQCRTDMGGIRVFNCVRTKELLPDLLCLCSLCLSSWRPRCNTRNPSSQKVSGF